VFGVQAIVDFADPLSEEGQIPFSELVSLGGSRPLRGFLDQRLLGRSAAALEVSYRWPIWVSLDGELKYEVGNVFGRRLEDFEFEKLRQSFGLGFSAAGSRDHTFELLVALGTQTFEQGSAIDSFRFVFGSTAGF
jgi:hemolysin activation/secretion protein